MSSFPDFDFYTLPLSQPSRQQMAKIYALVRAESARASCTLTQLRDLIEAHRFDKARGLYVPISPHVYVKGMLPTLSESEPTVPPGCLLEPYLCYFANALVIPEHYGTPQFDLESVARPTLRATNAGFLVVTIEYDCSRIDEFEEILAWTRGMGGDFAKSALSMLDRALCKLTEYRRYSVVFTGGRSLHFHFVISTEHLKNAPFDADAEARLASQSATAALIDNAHREYWDHICGVMIEIFQPSLSPTTDTKPIARWRRAPWGVRCLAKPSLLGIPNGARVPQLVIREKIRERAAKVSTRFLLQPDFSTAHPSKVRRSTTVSKKDELSLAMNEETLPELVALLQQVCRDEWGSNYPKPVEVGRQGGEWKINFKNYPDDKKPSSVVIGCQRTLLLNGRHFFGNRRFFLPDGMSAKELCEHVTARLGHPIGQPLLEPTLDQSTTDLPMSDFERMKAESGKPLQMRIGAAIKRKFAEPISEAPRQEVVQNYRGKLQGAITTLRSSADSCPLIIKSVEGIGKSTQQLQPLLREAFDEAVAQDDEVDRFAAFSFRTRAQAQQRAAEFSARGYRVRVIRTFRDPYEEACRVENQTPIPRDDFDDSRPKEVLDCIRWQQPSVFERLETTRKKLWNWNLDTQFSAGATLLSMSHKAAQTWYTSVLTRAWHQPAFDALGSTEQHHELAKKFILSRVIMDDPELDDFLHILPEAIYEFVAQQQKINPDWRNLSRQLRLHTFKSLRDACAIPGNAIGNFDSFDELMRINVAGSGPDRLELVTVDFDAIPFGCDQIEKGIYRKENGKKFYVGVKRWLWRSSAHFSYLTTEDLVLRVIQALYCRLGENGADISLPFTADLDQTPPIFPVKIPLFLDPRARMDRPGKPGVTALAGEIIKSDANAIVVSNGVNTGLSERVFTYQAMKGSNDFKDNNVYVLLTFLAPAKYAELNIIGQWLGIPDIIGRHYFDEIHQVVGRNRGFRESDSSQTKTALITSRRLWQSVLKNSQCGSSRVILYPVQIQPWLPELQLYDVA